MITIYEMLQLINEYDTSGNVMNLAMMTSKGTSGKTLDNIATGKTNVNKTPSYRKTKKEFEYPELSKIVQTLKTATDANSGDKILTGKAAEEMKRLEQTNQLKQDVDGSFIVPLGDNIRMRKIYGAYSLGYNNPNSSDIKNTTQTDKELTQLPLL